MNVEWLFHLPAPVRRRLYFGLQRAVGSRLGEVWREFQSWEGLSSEGLKTRVEARLAETLSGAVQHNAYYRELGLAPRSGEPATEFLRRFPILPRPTVRARFTDLVIDSLRHEITSPQSVARRRYDWLVVKTGGTTGNPTTVVHDARARDWGRATRLFSARQCGHPLGTRYFRLWGSETDLLQTQASLSLRVQAALLGYVPMNAFRSREADLQRHYETMRQHPEIDSLMTYVDAAVILARYIQDRKLRPPPLRTIMACAGTVTAESRAVLQDVFGAEVFDKYGSRECCDVACECRAHQGLHVYSPNVFLEVVDAAGASCVPGQTGRILVTLLNNPTFPLIRYEIGDVGQWAEPGRCGCGLAWPRLQSLQGRADDMLLTEDGTLLSSVFVRHFVGVSLNRQLIREWQLEQTASKRFVFRFIPVQTEGLAANLEIIQKSFRQVLGQSVAIEARQVTELPLSATGKMRWIINSVGQPEAAPPSA
ncbi:MAG: phenylacetate--CoA ligase family protein [Verrucomicrobia bacterium]|nr:phenylacetate--CoA ligase family protein [Verrucomicrobiota bacterium]